jgi:hypothetical protein
MSIRPGKKLVVLDYVNGVFYATNDGVTKKTYTPEEIIKGQHLKDFPGHDVASPAWIFQARK